MTYDERREVYTNALIRYGEPMQLIVGLEELSECQKEICKFLRGLGNAGDLAEAVADAMIMLEQVQLIFGIEDMVNREVNRKISRLDGKLKGIDPERTNRDDGGFGSTGR